MLSIPVVSEPKLCPYLNYVNSTTRALDMKAGKECKGGEKISKEHNFLSASAY